MKSPKSAMHISAESRDLVLSEQTTEELRANVLAWYSALGGAEFFDELAKVFYQLVADDEQLSPLFDGSWSVHARRLATHFHRMYGRAELDQAWNPQLLAVHTKFLISHEHRSRWISLFAQAGKQVAAPEPAFSELVAIMLIAAGDMMAASRGAALQRGDRFDALGRPR